MKIFILIFIVFIVSIIVTLKLVTSPEPVMSPDSPALDSREYDAGKHMHQDNKETLYRQTTETEIDNQKLMAFAKAYINVQSYMNRVGSKASYKETKTIVQNHGLSVEDYTRIATLINESPDLRNSVQKMINEAK